MYPGPRVRWTWNTLHKRRRRGYASPPMAAKLALRVGREIGTAASAVSYRWTARITADRGNWLHFRQLCAPQLVEIWDHLERHADGALRSMDRSTGCGASTRLES